MRAAVRITCPGHPCGDVQHGGFTVPAVGADAGTVRLITVLESPAADAAAARISSHLKTTLQAFRSAGARAATMADLRAEGVYVTTALKCPKLGYSVSRTTADFCSALLEAEIGLFPNARVIMLMGDTAIATMNAIARRSSGRDLIPSGPAYRVRRGDYRWNGMRVIPSYPCTGHSYLIEASKRDLIAADLRAGLATAGVAASGR
jgi:hypothetical protein